MGNKKKVAVVDVDVRDEMSQKMAMDDDLLQVYS